MLLSDLFKDLSYGALSNLSMGGEGSGSVPVAHQPRIITLAGQGLQALSRRFHLVEKEVVLRTFDHITLYRLKKQFAFTQAGSEPKYIFDSEADPFLEDVVKILGIYDEVSCEIPLNDPGDCRSFFTPAFDTVQIPCPRTGDAFYLIYRALYPQLDPTTIDENAVIDLPPVLEEALRSWIAGTIYSGISGQEASAKREEHLLAYERVCLEVEQKDLVQSSLVQSNDKFHARGFI